MPKYGEKTSYRLGCPECEAEDSITVPTTGAKKAELAGLRYSETDNFHVKWSVGGQVKPHVVSVMCKICQNPDHGTFRSVG